MKAVPAPVHLAAASVWCGECIQDHGVASASTGPSDGSWIVIVGVGKQRVTALADAIASLSESGDDPVRRALVARVLELEAQLAAVGGAA